MWGALTRLSITAATELRHQLGLQRRSSDGVTYEVMTTRWTLGLFFLIDLRTPTVPLTAGTKSSSGSSAFMWNGEAVWATPSTPLTASSKAPSCGAPGQHTHPSTGRKECHTWPMSSTMTYSKGTLEPLKRFTRNSPLSFDLTVPTTGWPASRKC